jgi:hypothetical protein
MSHQTNLMVLFLIFQEYLPLRTPEECPKTILCLRHT